uniref:Uncharacterized mitochondrial protein AtMg00810-like n=1 Tax=Nicotiana tabacum TaxID=4097 RepID=A0A1S3XWI6_TOBAC|nr:PREDICTED: uncharacterized mitochondrial protein AtMg00810-like [Nicotiana tabacum]
MAGNGEDNVDLVAREAAQRREQAAQDAEEEAIRDGSTLSSYSPSLPPQSTSFPISSEAVPVVRRGYVHSLNDYSLFTWSSGESFVILVVYVDDIIITGTDLAEVFVVKAFFYDQFKIKDLGNLNYFLGIEVLHTESGVLLHQKKFIHNLLKEFHSSDCSSVVCLLEMHEKLKATEGDVLPNPERYIYSIGKLNFLIHTKPGISFAVQYLSSRKSVSGFCILLGGSVMSWKSKKQSVVSLSSAEVEYRSMSKATAKITWVFRLLYDLGIHVSSPIQLFCDNQESIHIAKNQSFTSALSISNLIANLSRANSLNDCFCCLIPLVPLNLLICSLSP